MAIAKLIQNAKNTIVFTGAGMSTESGLPDFRSPKRGLWAKFNPDELANVNALTKSPQEFTDFYRQRLNDIKDYQPHEGHLILADWEKKNRINGIITQNVDGFHHDAGSKNVMELHGTFRSFHCHSCTKTYDQNMYLSGTVTCSCGGTIRPGIVLFGETLPEYVFVAAERETLAADLFIVLGSSLTVTPANMFPTLAKENGANLIIVNREPTPIDHLADFVIHHKSIKEFLVETNQLLVPGQQ